jgi:hypothetical protein
MQKLTINQYIKSHFGIAALIIIIIVYIFNGIEYLQAQSITDDEGAFFNYAKRYATGHPERLNPVTDNSKMPVNVLNAVPRIAQQLIYPGLRKNDNGVSDIMMGRYVTLFISVLTILLVFKWAKELYGKNAGLFAAFLMSWCPNNLANAALVTTDSYSVLFLLASIYFLWRFCITNANKYFILLSVTVAAGQLVKQSLFHLYILVPVCIMAYYILNKKHLHIKKLFKYLLIFLFINWFVINAGYYFNGSNTTLGNYHFISNVFKGLQGALPSWLPLPLPKPFIEGLDMAKHYDQVGGGNEAISSFGKVTILGQSATGGAFWYYYFVSIWFKTPIAYFIFLSWSTILSINRFSFKKWLSNEFFLLAPVVYFLIILSFFYKTQCGIRHIIFIYPFLLIICSSVVPHVKTIYTKIATTVIAAFLVLSVLHYWRNYYPYTNEFILDKKTAYNYVGAGNLDFQQGFLFYKEYLDGHPGVHWATPQPQTGTFLITTDDYLDIWNRHKYDWLTKYKPIGHVAYSGLLVTTETAR